MKTDLSVPGLLATSFSNYGGIMHWRHCIIFRDLKQPNQFHTHQLVCSDASSNTSISISDRRPLIYDCQRTIIWAWASLYSLLVLLPPSEYLLLLLNSKCHFWSLFVHLCTMSAQLPIFWRSGLSHSLLFLVFHIDRQSAAFTFLPFLHSIWRWRFSFFSLAFSVFFHKYRCSCRQPVSFYFFRCGGFDPVSATSTISTHSSDSDPNHFHQSCITVWRRGHLMLVWALLSHFFQCSDR